mgnify:CR=1 FL=1
MTSPIRSMKYLPTSASSVASWQDRVRSQLIDLMKVGDQIFDKEIHPFESETISSKEIDKYQVTEMKINSTPFRQIEIVVTTPNEFVDFCPAVVAIAGHGGNRHTCYTKKSYHKCAHVLAQQGFVTISTEVSQHDVKESAPANGLCLVNSVYEEPIFKRINKNDLFPKFVISGYS